MKKYGFGFTLLEVLAVLVLIIILAAVLIPSYQSYLLKSRRTDALETIMRVQVAEERYRLKNTSYSASAYSDTESVQKHYQINITTSADPNYYQVTATAQGQQTNDTSCTTFTLTYNNGTTTKTSSPNTDCWNN